MEEEEKLPISFDVSENPTRRYRQKLTGSIRLEDVRVNEVNCVEKTNETTENGAVTTHVPKRNKGISLPYIIHYYVP